MNGAASLAGDVSLFLAETTLQSALLFMLVWLISRSLGAQYAALRSNLWLMVIICPVVVPLITHILLPRFVLHLKLRALEQVLAGPSAWLSVHQLAAALIVGAILMILFGLDLARWLLCALRVAGSADGAGDNPQAARCVAMLSRIRQRLGLRGGPEVCVDGRRPVGIYSLRWPRPRICLSRRLAERLDDGELQAALTHEVAHLQRRDWLRLCAAQLFRDLAFFNPFVHLAYRAYRQATEEAADDAATATRQERLTLASSLLKVQAFLQRGPAAQTSLGLIQPGTDVAARVKRLVSQEPDGPASAFQHWAGWGVLAVALLLATVI